MKLGVYENMNMGEFGCGGGVGRMKNMIKIQCIKLIHKYIKKDCLKKSKYKEVSSSLPIKKKQKGFYSVARTGLEFTM